MTTPDPQPLADEPQERQTTAHERVWCGPIFAVDAAHLRALHAIRSMRSSRAA